MFKEFIKTLDMPIIEMNTGTMSYHDIIKLEGVVEFLNSLVEEGFSINLKR